MGELQGRRTPDRPEAPPEDAGSPIRRVEVEYLNKARPAPGPADVLVNARTPRERPEHPKREAPDGPTHRAPDVDRPSGKDLVEEDAPRRGDRFRKVLAETAADASDVASKVGENIDGFRKPPTGRPEVRSPHPVVENSTPHGVDTGHLLTATFVAGILLGEGLRLGYRKGSELKEKWHARNG